MLAGTILLDVAGDKSLPGGSLDPKAFSKNIHGNAQWMGADEFESLGLGGSRGVILGQRKNGDLVRFDGDGHVMVFAPTGAGKGTGFVQPNLVKYGGSMVVLDPKSENAIVGARCRRSMGQSVVILDPFGGTGQKGQTYNPLSALTYASSQTVGPWLECLAEALIKDEGAKEQHWVVGARKFAVFLMWWMIAHEPPEKRNLIRLFELVHGGRDLIGKMAAVMAEGRSPDPEVARLCKALGNWFLGRQEREFSYFESICINQLGWVGDFVWKDVLSGPPSPPLQLKTKPTTVFLCLPFHRLERYQGWLRLMVADLITTLFDTPGRPDEPVLFLLDEAYAGLGKMEFLFTAAATVRGAGARLAFVYQDVLQIGKIYKDSWQSLIANSGATTFFSINDPTTAQFVSGRCGTKTTPVPGNPVGMPEPLLRPENAMKMPKDEIIGFFRNASPAKFGLIDVLTDHRFKAHLDPNTTYGKAKERTYTARTDYVPVDLSSVTAPGKVHEHEETEEEFFERASDTRLENLSNLTGIALLQLQKLEAKFGKLVLKGSELGYVGPNGTFETLLSAGG